MFIYEFSRTRFIKNTAIHYIDKRSFPSLKTSKFHTYLYNEAKGRIQNSSKTKMI